MWMSFEKVLDTDLGYIWFFRAFGSRAAEADGVVASS